ncbi:hypothetical protein DA73_0400005180 [Tolypothrix bouteillei VB521301]|uniref:Uncharacterized protein n=1 Tax=Tolypothrix bouteillei VB521301 TaxID=1479485 RepID=A0A8S9T045_9CYAN|nr:hypothetical protein DA73_0400005180 [Tolypothrix bouteillei VB521301]
MRRRLLRSHPQAHRLLVRSPPPNSMYQLGLGNLTLFLFDTHPMSLQKKLSKELVQLPANKGEDIGINFIFSASLLVILGCLIAPLAIPGLSQQNQALRKPDTVMIH